MRLKFTITFLAFFLVSNFLVGQKRVANTEPIKQVKNTFFQGPTETNARSMMADTILPSIFLDDDCSVQLLTFGINGFWGFIGGQNEFFDLEKAQRFVYDSDNFTLEEVFIFMATVDVVGDGDMFIKIYDVDGQTNGPGAVLATSNPVKASDLNVDETAVIPTRFTFDSPVQINQNEFFVSVDFRSLYEAQDTVSLLHTDADCGVEGDAWELFGDNESWVSMSDTLSWSIGDDIYKANFLMIATVQPDGVSTTKELIVGNHRITLQEAFPNPTKGQLNIPFSLETTTTISIEIYSLTGQKLREVAAQDYPAGEYQRQLDISDLSSGTYLYGLRTANDRLMNKFTVAK